MYSSKYAIPLEIDNSSTIRGKRKSQPNRGEAAESFNWLEAFKLMLRLIWSLVVGTIYFFISLWKQNPWLKGLPWFKMSVLVVFAYVLILRPTPPPHAGDDKLVLAGLNEEDVRDTNTPESIKPLAQPALTTTTAATSTTSTGPTAPKENRSVAPADPAKLGKVAVQDFIKRFSQTAVDEMELFNIPASIKMGQAIIESQSGNSVLAKESLNFFGIKCKSKCKSCTCRNYEDDGPYDMFRVFDTAWESWRAHSKLLCNPRYAKLPLYGKDYKKWAKGLKKAGYATDPSYDKKLIAVIEKYDLTKLDR